VRNVLPFSRVNKSLDRDELAFLPAALEIVETPPSPVGRTIAFSIIALFCLALGWAFFGRVDIVASAEGKIIPSGRTKVIQPFETGVVRAIEVLDGQTVKAGETLIELDPTIDDAQWMHYQSDLVSAQLDVARLQAVLGDGDPAANFKPPADASTALVASQRQFLLDQIAEQKAKIELLDKQQQQKEAEQGTVEAKIGKLQASLPILEKEAQTLKRLNDEGAAPLLQYLEQWRAYIEEEHDLDVEQHHLQETRASIAAIEKQRTESIAEFRRERYADLVEAQRKVKGLSEDVISAKHRATLQVLKAPVDGTVQQLAVHTIGGVVTPAQALLVLVPADSHLEIEAMVQNRDIGFVHPGQDAQIKIDTFNFSRYGLLHGKVLNVSPDAITRDKPPDKVGKNDNQGAEDVTSEPKGQELVYAARVSLDREQMQVDDRLVHLSPGMAVTVEIKTGSRRIVSYLLSPLMRYTQNSLRER
jgi:hemolysin D